MFKFIQQPSELLGFYIPVDTALIFNPFCPCIKPGIVVPETIGIFPAFEALDIIDIVFRACLAEVVWDSQISAVLCARLCAVLDLDAAFFALQSTMGALKYFLHGQHFAPSDQSRFFVFDQIELFINGYDIRQRQPLEVLQCCELLTGLGS